jgi:hypothetical protein
MGEKRNSYRLLVGKPEGKRPLGRPRHRWVDNIRMDLGEVGWGDVDWIDHVVNVMDPYGRILRFLDRRRYFFFQVAGIALLFFLLLIFEV